MTMPREAALRRARRAVRRAADRDELGGGPPPGDATKALSHDEVSAESSKRTATITTCIVDLFKNAQA